eukprot:12282673-Ditylum_brightwellii.AAC.1
MKHLPMGMDSLKDPRTVERWFVDFRDSSCKLVILALSMQKRRKQNCLRSLEFFQNSKRQY